MPKLIPLRIDRKRWCRGGKHGESFLLNAQDAMCCLGFACKKLGVPKEALDHSTPASVDKKYSSKLGLLVNRKGRDRGDTVKAVKLNDDLDLTEEDRENKLVPVLKRLGFDVTFVGKDD